MSRRDPRTMSERKHDLIVVGGGIYGVSVALEAARRGLKPLLLERDDYGQHCSANSLRILHGGLRYLQTGDLPRFFESVAERRWFLRHFPDCTQPLNCLMPLYGRGLKRPSVFRIALRLNDILSYRRNAETPIENHLGAGKVISKRRTIRYVPGIPDEGLVGSGEWLDGLMTSAPRLLMEMLRWMEAGGGRSLNYMSVTEIRSEDGIVCGVSALDGVDDAEYEFDAPVVINCAGQWAPELADQPKAKKKLDRPSLAFNLLLDRPAVSRYAVALEPDRGAGRMYFLTPMAERLMVGTMHLACADDVDASQPSVPNAEQIQLFLDELNACLPDLKVLPKDVVRIWSGLIPAPRRGADQPGHRAVMLRHDLKGLFSLQGVKYTTARHEAERVLRIAFGKELRKVRKRIERPTPRIPRVAIHSVSAGACDAVDLPTAEVIRAMVNEESVVHLDDLLLRRTDWGVMPDNARRLAPVVLDILGWHGPQREMALKRLATILDDDNGSSVAA